MKMIGKITSPEDTIRDLEAKVAIWNELLES